MITSFETAKQSRETHTRMHDTLVAEIVQDSLSTTIQSIYC